MLRLWIAPCWCHCFCPIAALPEIWHANYVHTLAPVYCQWPSLCSRDSYLWCVFSIGSMFHPNADRDNLIVRIIRHALHNYLELQFHETIIEYQTWMNFIIVKSILREKTLPTARWHTNLLCKEYTVDFFLVFNKNFGCIFDDFPTSTSLFRPSKKEYETATMNGH